MDIEERVRLVGGTCTVKAAPGAGTEVAIELPLHASTAATARRVSEVASATT